MPIRLVTTLNELDALVPHWRRLTQGQPFLSPTWLTVWWRHFGFGHGRRLMTLVVTDELDQVVAIAPWYLEDSRIHGKTLRFLGCGPVCSEYLSIPCRPGWERRAAAAIAGWLCPAAGDVGDSGARVWQLLRLESLSADDPMIDELCKALGERGAITTVLPSTNCWRLTLPQSWEEYLALLSKSHRKRVRRLERDYFQNGRARLLTADTGAQVKEGFRILVDMHAQRWASRGARGIFDDAVVSDFHRAATAELLASRQLRLSWLELDGQPVAAEYSLVGDGVLYAYQSGMAPGAGRHEPGTLALIATLRAAIDEGIRCVDFLRGDEPYKRHWRAALHATRYVRVLPDRWSGHLRHRFWQAARSTKRWLRTGRDAIRTTAPRR